MNSKFLDKFSKDGYFIHKNFVNKDIIERLLGECQKIFLNQFHKSNFQNWIVGISDFSRVDLKSKYILDKKLNLSSLESKQLIARLILKSYEFENKYDYEYNL